MYFILNKATFTNNIGTIDITTGTVTPPTGGGSGGSEPEIPVTPTNYTITYKYMSGSTEIKTATTESVSAGTSKTFSTSSAPGINGYTVSSVSPSGVQTINSNITVTYTYTANEASEPTNYTFTINPTPTSATVTLTASGYTQNGNSITVSNGTTVSWSVSASGYTTRTGTWIANGENKTESIVLVASSGGGGTSSDSVDLTTLSNVKTSDVTYAGGTGTFTSTSTSGITGSSGKVGTALTFIVQEPLTAGMEVEVAITDTDKKNMVLGLNNNNTIESLVETATYNGKIMATPVNLYLDPGSSNTITSFKSGEASLVKPKCTGDGATIVRSAEEVTYIITFKRAADGTITAWQDGKQIIPPADASENNAGLTTQWNSLNSVANVYLCGHGVSKYISCKINYFGKLR